MVFFYITTVIWSIYGNILLHILNLTFNRFNNNTSCERISCEPLRACTCRRMVKHRTFCILSTASRTRVPTLHIHAGFIRWTILVNGALRLAIWREAKIIRQTSTRRSAINITAYRVIATWTWYAWIFVRFWYIL